MHISSKKQVAILCDLALKFHKKPSALDNPEAYLGGILGPIISASEASGLKIRNKTNTSYPLSLWASLLRGLYSMWGGYADESLDSVSAHRVARALQITVREVVHIGPMVGVSSFFVEALEAYVGSDRMRAVNAGR